MVCFDFDNETKLLIFVLRQNIKCFLRMFIRLVNYSIWHQARGHVPASNCPGIKVCVYINSRIKALIII